MSLKWLDYGAGLHIVPAASSTGPYLDFTPLVLTGKRYIAYLSNTSTVILVDPSTNVIVKVIAVPNPFGSINPKAVGLTFDGKDFWVSKTDVGGVTPDLILKMDTNGNAVSFFITLLGGGGAQGSIRQLSFNRRCLYALNFTALVGATIDVYDMNGILIKQLVYAGDNFDGITFDHGHFFIVNLGANAIDMFEGTLTTRLKQLVNPAGGTYTSGITHWNRYLLVQQ